MRKLTIAILLLALFSLPVQSFALSCEEPPPPDIAYEEYDAVIIGTVDDIRERSDEKILTIQVEKSFKGVNKKIIAVEEDLTWGESQLNAEHLFYLNKEGEEWVHPLCSPTTLNTGIADEFYADKEEIVLEDVALEDVNTAGSWPKGVIFLIAVAVFFAIIAAVFLIVRRRKN
ncbi:hypothetical protein [Planococcus lenghuensis]|uniref:CbiN domain protein n=1 Tax=Planococcus lenghuensis TaxID=2213202 RepID=A0A1Q2L4K0_9BACL|nr:hypothetical protein [Planococcus lenghuensis]AQQ54792.1 hypothetical protein B0X71_17910 [Planococcus lenghuensis]